MTEYAPQPKFKLGQIVGVRRQDKTEQVKIVSVLPNNCYIIEENRREKKKVPDRFFICA